MSASCRHSVRRQLPNFSSHQKLHCHWEALIYGKQLRDLHVLAPARIPTHVLSHRLLLCFLPVPPRAAVVEEVLLHLSRGLASADAPAALVVLSVHQPLYIRSNRRMPGLQSVKPCCQ